MGEWKSKAGDEEKTGRGTAPAAVSARDCASVGSFSVVPLGRPDYRDFPGDYNGPRPLALRPRDAARALSVSEKTLYNLTRPHGPIPAAKVGRIVLYDLRDLLAFLDAAKMQSDGP